MMKQILVKALFVSALVLNLPAAAAAAAAADDRADVEATLARAASAHEQAMALEHGWSVTQPFIDEARAALDAGDMERAAAAADRALLTAEKSLEQARVEAQAWQDRVLGS